MAHRTIQDLIASKCSEISSAEAIIDDLKENLRDLRAELKGIEEAAMLLSQEIAPQTVGRGKTLHSNGRRGRGLSTHWKAALWEIGQATNKTVKIKEVMAICDAVGAPATPNTVRSQIAQFVKRGYLRRVGRVGEGVYQLTDEGVRASKRGQKKIKKAPGSSEPSAPSHHGDGNGSLSSSGSREAHSSLAALSGAIPADPGAVSPREKGG